MYSRRAAKHINVSHNEFDSPIWLSGIVEGFELANTALKWKRVVIAAAVKAAVLSDSVLLTCESIFSFPSVMVLKHFDSVIITVALRLHQCHT